MKGDWNKFKPNSLKAKLAVCATIFLILGVVFAGLLTANDSKLFDLSKWISAANLGRSNIAVLPFHLKRLNAPSSPQELETTKRDLQGLLESMDKYFVFLQSGEVGIGVPGNRKHIGNITRRWFDDTRPSLGNLINDPTPGQNQKDWKQINDFLPLFSNSIRQAVFNAEKETQTLVRRLILLNAVAFFVYLLLIVFVAYSFRRLFISALSLVTFAKNIGKGNFDVSLDEEGDDEVSQIAESFNEMAANLRAITVSRNYVDRIFDTIVEGIFVLEENGIIKDANRGAEELTGYSRTEMTGKPMGEFLQGIMSLPGLIEKNKITNKSCYLTSKTEDRIPCLISGGLMRYGAGLRIILTVKDMTELKKMERRVHEEQAKATAASKMATLGEMASGIAHEINNPLTVVSGYAQQCSKLLTVEPVDIARLQRNSVRIGQSADRIGKIVTSLRNFARDGSNDPFHEVYVLAIIEDVLELCFARARSRGVLLEISNFSDQLTIESRGVEISQVILNLVSNAVDAVEKLSEKWIKVDVWDKDDFIELWVTDSGKGIAVEHQEKILDPFFTTKELGKGTGLGLSISKGIVESHRGTFQLDVKCKNTRFVIVLPKSQKFKAKEAA